MRAKKTPGTALTQDAATRHVETTRQPKDAAQHHNKKLRAAIRRARKADISAFLENKDLPKVCDNCGKPATRFVTIDIDAHWGCFVKNRFVSGVDGECLTNTTLKQFLVCDDCDWQWCIPPALRRKVAACISLYDGLDSAARKQSGSRSDGALKDKSEVVSSHEYRKRALASLLESDFDAALAYASDAIRLDPNDVELRKLRSAIHYAIGNHCSAGKHGCGFGDWEEAIRLDPSLANVALPSASEFTFDLRPLSDLPKDIDLWHDEHEGCDDKWVDHSDNHVERAAVRSGTEYTVWQDGPLTEERKRDLIDEFVESESRRDYEEAAEEMLSALGVEDC